MHTYISRAGCNHHCPDGKCDICCMNERLRHFSAMTTRCTVWYVNWLDHRPGNGIIRVPQDIRWIFHQRLSIDHVCIPIIYPCAHFCISSTVPYLCRSHASKILPVLTLSWRSVKVQDRIAAKKLTLVHLTPFHHLLKRRLGQYTCQSTKNGTQSSATRVGSTLHTNGSSLGRVVGEVDVRVAGRDGCSKPRAVLEGIRRGRYRMIRSL